MYVGPPKEPFKQLPNYYRRRKLAGKDTQWEPETAHPISGKYTGGRVIISRPPKTKHMVKGIWKATPYLREVVNTTQGDRDGFSDTNGRPLYDNRYQYWGRYKTFSPSWWSTELNRSGNHGSTFANLANRARVEAMLRLNSGDIDVGVGLAESRQTLGMLSEAFAELSGGIADASNGDWSKVRSRFGSLRGPRGKSLSSRWLQYQYGWLPLMSDIYGLHSELQKGLLRKGQTVTGKSSVSQEGRSDWTWSGEDPSKRTSATTNCGVSCSITAVVSDPYLAKLQALGLINPLSIAWERTPWSFVVDWGLPVGNVIRAFTAPVGLTFFTGSVTYRTHTKLSGVYPAIGGSSPSNDNSSTEVTPQGQGLRVERLVLSGFPTPMLYTRPIFSTKRVLNALALVDQNMGRTRR